MCVSVDKFAAIAILAITAPGRFAHVERLTPPSLILPGPRRNRIYLHKERRAAEIGILAIQTFRAAETTLAI